MTDKETIEKAIEAVAKAQGAILKALIGMLKMGFEPTLATPEAAAELKQLRLEHKAFADIEKENPPDAEDSQAYYYKHTANFWHKQAGCLITRIEQLEAENKQLKADWRYGCGAARLEAIKKAVERWTQWLEEDVAGAKQILDLDTKTAMRDKELEAKQVALDKIENWCKAYPLEAFPEPDLKKAAKVLKAAGMTLDCISASNARHVLRGIQKHIDEAKGA